MVNILPFKVIAWSLPEATADPHFDKVSFKVGKRYNKYINIKQKVKGTLHAVLNRF